MRLFDSHAHLTDERFARDRDDVLDRAAEAGVDSIVTIASHVDDAKAGLELARLVERPRVFSTVGIHPHEADRFDATAPDRIEELAGAERVVAIGETGLDFHYDNAPRDRQIAAFRAHLELAAALEMPVIVHSRDADERTAGLVAEFDGRVSGVLHCFTGGAELMETALGADWYISFSGIVTFGSYQDEDRVVGVPADRLLVETDSPYLAPVPRRGRRNEPANVRHVAERVGELRGIDAERVASLTYANACRFYGVGG